MKTRSYLVMFLLIFFAFINVPAINVQAVENVGVKYRAHVQNIGWQSYVSNGEMAGTTGNSLRLEQINISLENPVPGMRVKYRAHVQNIGWQPWVYDGQGAGTSGRSLRIEAVQVLLEGAPAGYHVQYQVYVQSIGWQNWVQDGALAGTEGKALRLEAMRIKIVSDNSASIENLQGTVASKQDTEQITDVKYRTHVQEEGWQSVVYDGQMAGTSGKSLRLEEIQIALENAVPGMKIKYKTHVQNIGWQNWVYDGQGAGTSGKSLRLEGVKIMLENAPTGYHVQYQVHVQNEGWQNWVQDGELAGTEGKSYRLEGIRIRIVKDDDSLTGGLAVTYKSHVQNVGWQDYTSNGGFSGTQGQAYRIEAMNISLVNPPAGMKLKYQSYVEGKGWEPWLYDGALTGTEGKGLRLEGLKIMLEGAPAWFRVKYQVHVQDKGWISWKYDGDIAGLPGKGLRIEGIRVMIEDLRTYVNYTITQDDMVAKQIAKTPALQMKNSSNQWEWRYAQIKDGQEGYFIYVARKDEQGNIVKNSSGNTINDESFINSPEVYQTIKQEIIKNVNPSLVAQNNAASYQFLKLSYVDGITAAQLNSLFNPEGVLAGKGQIFIDAAKANNVHPIYLAAHAILETGNGTSTLARGVEVNGVKVYNLFGIQAIDSNPLYGATYAASKGWTSIDKAIYGGAEWISSGYINHPTYKQDTIYKMRWNPQNPTLHQYATDIQWASKQTAYIKQCFDMVKGAKMVFEIPVYSK